MSTRHLEVIHVSDLHFGHGHVFDPGRDPNSHPLPKDGIPTLAEKLVEDIEKFEPETPWVRATSGHWAANSEAVTWDVPPLQRVLCLTGDLTCKGTDPEFQEALGFVKRVSSSPAFQLSGGKDVCFVIPGNHDLNWNETESRSRWKEYANFLSEWTDRYVAPTEPEKFGGVSIVDCLGVIVVGINSELPILNKDGPRESGHVTEEQIAWVRGELDKALTDDRRGYIRIAMIHHHPILIPAVAEADRAYDAVINADKLLRLLHDYKFHVLLHGHKHLPHTLVENVRMAIEESPEHSLVVVAGGSAGSPSLPHPETNTQCYNRVRIHVDDEQGTTRVQVITRGLQKYDERRRPLLVCDWRWKTLSVDDRWFVSNERRVAITAAAWNLKSPPPATDIKNIERTKEYERTRGNFAVAEVVPSMVPGQTREVRLWIVSHASEKFPRDPAVHDPVRVTWSAGQMFPSVTIRREDDPNFCALFTYWGGALFQAEMEFADGEKTWVYTYAWMNNRTPPTATPQP